MPMLLSALGGVAIAYFLIESGYAIHALMLTLVWILLLWTVPVLSFYFLGLLSVLAMLYLLIVFWEAAAALVLSVVLFFLIVGGLLHAVEALK